MFKYKIGDITFIVVKNSLKDEKSDALFNWTVSDLSGGDPNFMEIHKEGGSLIYKECQGVLTQFGKQTLDGTKAIPVGEAVLKQGGKTALQRFLIDIGTLGKKLTKLGTGAGNVSLGFGFGSLEGIKNDETAGDVVLDGIISAAISGGVGLTTGILARSFGTDAAGTKLQQFLKPRLDKALKNQELKQGLLVYSKGKNPVVKLRIPSEEVVEISKTMKNEIPGIEKLDVGTAVSKINDKIGERAEKLKPRLKGVKSNPTAIDDALTDGDALQDKLLESGEFVGFESTVEKKMAQFRDRLDEFKGKDLNDFWELRKAVDSVDESIKSYDISSSILSLCFFINSTLSLFIFPIFISWTSPDATASPTISPENVFCNPVINDAPNDGFSGTDCSFILFLKSNPPVNN